MKWIEMIECRSSKTFQNYFRGLQLLFCIFYHIRKWKQLRDLIWLDIPNVRYAKLPHSFKNVIHPVVDSIPNWIFDTLDVSESLFPKLNHFDSLQQLDPTITSLVLSDWTGSDTNDTPLDFSRFTLVESIVIGSNCFGSIKTFKIDGLNRLKSLKIGKNSFTLEKASYGSDKSKSFHILNCESLESIKIGEYSFSDFAGDFELKNLPQLHSIEIGEIGILSFNFLYSSFVIRGSDLIVIIWND